jgi:hypothetical protein
MGRKYEFASGKYAWNLEKCEEEVLIAGYEEIVPYIPPDQTSVKTEFENNFFATGNGVAIFYIDFINTVRKRRGLVPTFIRETQASDYVRSADRGERASNRCQTRQELRDLSEDERRRRVQAAEVEIARQPEPHFTYEEYEARRTQLKNDTRLSAEEVSRRIAVRETKRADEARTLSPKLAARMLGLASKAMYPEIIAKLRAEDALDVAAEIDDSELRDLLVRHSLSIS